MTQLPRTRRQRRRLSKPIPWQLPAAALLFLCAVVLVLRRPLDAGSEQAITDAAATQRAKEGLLSSDPLNDPAVRESKLATENTINILVLGTDGRDEEHGPPRTDLLMLALLDRTEHRVTLISIPRDLWVPIPGHGEGKINTAYFLGSLQSRGTELATETVEQLTGVTIDHTVQVDFNGFRTLVDQLGGIEVDVPEPVDDRQFPDGNYGYIHLKIPAGNQHMDGKLALQYARTRHGSSDQARSQRQQAILMAIWDRALEPAQLAQAARHLRTAYRVIETDLSLGDLFALARIARNLDKERITMHTLDGNLVWPVLTWNGQDALLYDPQILQETIQKWVAGEN